MSIPHHTIWSMVFVALLISEVSSYQCVWSGWNMEPGHRSLPEVSPTCREDAYESRVAYEAKCDNYIDFVLQPCYKENFLGILVGGYYKYLIDIKVNKPRNQNLFVTDLSSYEELRVETLDLSNGDLTTVPNEIFRLKYLKYLDLSHNRIQNVRAISYFALVPGLDSIDFSHNEIEDISPFFSSGFTLRSSLTEMDLSHNRLTMLSIVLLSCFPKMETLDMSYNEIDTVHEDYDFQGPVSLKRLYLSNNKLTTIKDRAFKRISSNLVDLDVSNNSIDRLDSYYVADFPQVELLEANNNQIDTLDNFSKFPKLKFAILNKNKISKITTKMFENNLALYSVRFDDNPINIIESNSFQNNKRLSQVILKRTRLTSIESGALNGIEYDNPDIDLSENGIMNIEDDTFAGVNNVYLLNVSSNALQNISNLAFHCLGSLHQLDLSHNQLQTINFNTKSLKKLLIFYAHHNRIEIIAKSIFENLISLQRLDLSYNNIKEMDPMSLANLINLEYIDVSYNTDLDIMKDLPFSTIQDLKEVSMVQTGNTVLKNNTFARCSNKLIFSSAFGNIKDIEYNAFDKCFNLEVLDLSHNKLESFHINTSSNWLIKKIYLNNNLIKEIGSYTFNSLRYLNTLNLANNDIINVEQTAFQNLIRLKFLNITSTAKPRNSLELTGLTQEFEHLYIGNFNLNMNFKNSEFSIKNLELKSCGIEDLGELNLYNIRNLEHLNLEGNDVTVINHESFKNVLSLISLNLRNNKISSIQPGSFLHMNGIRNLDLSGNNISSIFYGVLDGPQTYSHLNLSHNSLKAFDTQVLPPTSYLNLDRNPITSLSFDDISQSDVSKISVGNTMSCKYLVNLKRNFPNKFHDILTSDPINIYEQNIDGIPC